MPRSSDLQIAEGGLEGLRYVRLYLTDSGQRPYLDQEWPSVDYVFAYSLVDLGDIAGFEREVKATQLIDLSGTEDEVFNGLNKNNRYKVRRSFRDAEVEVAVGDENRDGSLAFYEEIKRADGVRPDIEDDFTSVLWINAYRSGSIISSTCWFDSGEVLRAKHIVSTRKDEESDTALIGRLTRRLFWEACVYGIGHGHLYVDLGGVGLDDPVKAGVSGFKQSFGGETVDVFVYRRTTTRWTDALADLRRQGREIP